MDKTTTHYIITYFVATLFGVWAIWGIRKLVKGAIKTNKETAELERLEQLKQANVVTSKTLSCPKCTGVAHGRYSTGIIVFTICLFPIGLLLLLVKKTYTCNGCGYKFKA